MKQDLIFDVDGLVQGNNLSTLPITIKNKGAVMDITGAIVRVAIKHGGSLFTKQAVISDAANGKCEVTLTREDLSNSGSFFYQPTITFPDGREFSGGIDRFNVTGKLSGPPPEIIPRGIDLTRLGINANGRLTIDGVEQTAGGSGGGSVPSNVILFEDWTAGESVTIDTGTTKPPNETPVPDPPADTTAPTVTASPNGGNFTTSQNVTLTANEPATIYYTLDGSTPSTSSTVYSAAINLMDTKNIKFFAKDSAGNQSAVQSVTFTKTVGAPSDTTAPVLTITAAASFTDTQTVNMSANETADIWFTVDGSDPVASGTRVKYTAPVTLTATTTVKAYAVDAAGNKSVVQAVVYTKQQSGYQSGDIIFYDNFDRVDSAMLGNGWTQFSSANGTHNLGVVGNKVTYTGGTWTTGVNKWRRFNTRTINSNHFALEVQTQSPTGTSAKLAVGIRVNGSLDNFIYLTKSETTGGASSQYILAKLPSGGSVTTLGTSTVKAAENDTIKIEHLSDGQIKVYINGSLQISVTDTMGLGASTVVGLGAELNTTLFDEFKVTAL